MWEMTSGTPVFNDLTHDFDLSVSICKGKRPEIVKVPKVFENMEDQELIENLDDIYIN